MDTQSLIQGLSKDARLARPRLGRVLAGALVLAALVAAGMFSYLLDPRADFMAAIETSRFVFKFVLTLTLAACAGIALFAAERPGARSRTFLLAIVPALALLAIGAEMMSVPEREWMARMVGSNSRYCLEYIPMIGIGPLAILLFAMRQGAPDSPARAGALAGLVSGGIAAALYASHCPDDSPFFVAVWYTIAVAMLTALGALAGSRVLRW
jgi:hypothetical protein